jgi:hypothetical protein
MKYKETATDLQSALSGITICVIIPLQFVSNQWNVTKGMVNM